MNTYNRKADTLLVGMYIVTTIFKNSLAIFSKVEDMLISDMYTLDKLLDICSRIHVQNGHSSTVFNGKKVGNISHIHR